MVISGGRRGGFGSQVQVVFVVADFNELSFVLIVLIWNEIEVGWERKHRQVVLAQHPINLNWP